MDEEYVRAFIYNRSEQVKELLSDLELGKLTDDEFLAKMDVINKEVLELKREINEKR